MSHPSRQTSPVVARPALLLAEYGTPGEVLHAAERVRDAGYTKWDVHTPFAVHGMDKAMGLGQSRLGWVCLFGGLTGCVLGFLMMFWMNGVDYPLVIGGKPPGAFISMVPVIFECTILFAGISAVVGMLVMNGLPRHHHPVFWSDRFRAASDDRFFVAVDASDPKFDAPKTRALLEATQAVHVELVEEGP